jgi:hypothetical protein
MKLTDGFWWRRRESNRDTDSGGPPFLAGNKGLPRCGSFRGVPPKSFVFRLGPPRRVPIWVPIWAALARTGAAS